MLLDGLLTLEQNNFTICLHGGEPLLAGKQWFAGFLNLIRDFHSHDSGKDISLAIQTNGALIDGEWADMFKQGEVGVSLSIDGPKNIHDFSRTDMSGNGSYEKIMSSIDLLRGKGIQPSAIAVLTKKSLESTPTDFYNHFIDIGIKDIDVTPYIETGATEVEDTAKHRYEAPAYEIGKYLADLFDVWLFNQDSKNLVNIRMFEQTIAVLLGFIPTVCNMQEGRSCGKNPCIMPNGDILACDLETEDIKLKLGSLASDDLKNILSAERIQELNNYIDRGLERMGCTLCRLRSVCGLTCPRHTFSKRDHTDYCNLQSTFIDHVKARLNDVALNTFEESISFAF
jgi:uncharacterized protein